MSGISIEVTDDQIRDAARAIVEEEMPEAIRDEVRRLAGDVIKQRVNERIGAVVDDMLANEQFVTSRWERERPLDEAVKGAVRSYLDERVYVYSATEDLPSKRFAQSCSQSGGPTRLGAYLQYSIERYCDEHLKDKLTPVVLDFLTERGGIEKVAREEMARLLREKFKI